MRCRNSLSVRQVNSFQQDYIFNVTGHVCSHGEIYDEAPRFPPSFQWNPRFSLLESARHIQSRVIETTFDVSRINETLGSTLGIFNRKLNIRHWNLGFFRFVYMANFCVLLWKSWRENGMRSACFFWYCLYIHSPYERSIFSFTWLMFEQTYYNIYSSTV
jgi:hypothetical protein